MTEETPVGATSDSPEPDTGSPVTTAPKPRARAKAKATPQGNADHEPTEAELIKAEKNNAKAEQARLDAINSSGKINFSDQPAVLGQDPKSKFPVGYTSEHFAVVHSDYFGNELVTINPRGWVGPDALKINNANLKELIDLLNKL